ncbi:hypothetical protein AB0O67_25390 [Streptomyces sp. NPDC086077]|uniref:hypothetical protein n=1 Tax=Streptomyces sp. NPDC086077 TaxID=3154862 RepID=UPI00341D5C03
MTRVKRRLPRRTAKLPARLERAKATSILRRETSRERFPVVPTQLSGVARD